MEKITSNQNNHVKEWKKLQTKKGRKKSNSYLLEGWHLVQEAIENGQTIKTILVVDDSDLAKLKLDKGIDLYLITEEIARNISDTQTPQGIFAVAELVEEIHQIPQQLIGSYIMLDGLQDPGNIGTIVRTADAAGLSGVVFGNGTTDIYNPKVTRSMQGSQFHINLYEGDLTEWIQSFKQANVPVYGTELNPQAVSLYDVDSGNQFGLVMGNEGNGISESVLSLTKSIYIPMKGRAESLNVAIAAGISMFYLNK